MKKHPVSAIVLAVAALFVTAAAPSLFAQDTPSGAPSGDPILIGEYTSLTGGQAVFGTSGNNGIQLAVEDINAAGGLLGRPVKVIVEDTRSTPGEAATGVRKLIANDKVSAIIGEFASARSLEGGPICQENKIPMISPGSTNPRVTQLGDYIFRTCFMDSFQGEVIAKFARSQGYKRAAILVDEKQPYSKGLTEVFRRVFTENGGEVIKEQSYASGDKDFRAQLISLKSAKPDVIFLPGYYNEVALIARQARQLGIKTPFMGGDGWEGSSLLPIAGNALDGCYYSGHFSAESPEPGVAEFVQKYKAKYGVQPDCQAALGYDTMRLLADAITRAGITDAAPLRDAIAATKDFPGVTGRITLDENRNARKPAVLQIVGEGRFKFVKNFEP